MDIQPSSPCGVGRRRSAEAQPGGVRRGAGPGGGGEWDWWEEGQWGCGAGPYCACAASLNRRRLEREAQGWLRRRSHGERDVAGSGAGCLRSGDFVRASARQLLGPVGPLFVLQKLRGADPKLPRERPAGAVGQVGVPAAGRRCGAGLGSDPPVRFSGTCGGCRARCRLTNNRSACRVSWSRL